MVTYEKLNELADTAVHKFCTFINEDDDEGEYGEWQPIPEFARDCQRRIFQNYIEFYCKILADDGNKDFFITSIKALLYGMYFTPNRYSHKLADIVIKLCEENKINSQGLEISENEYFTLLKAHIFNGQYTAKLVKLKTIIEPRNKRKEGKLSPLIRKDKMRMNIQQVETPYEGMKRKMAIKVNELFSEQKPGNALKLLNSYHHDPIVYRQACVLYPIHMPNEAFTTAYIDNNVRIVPTTLEKALNRCDQLLLVSSFNLVEDELILSIRALLKKKGRSNKVAVVESSSIEKILQYKDVCISKIMIIDHQSARQTEEFILDVDSLANLVKKLNTQQLHLIGCHTSTGCFVDKNYASNQQNNLGYALNQQKSLGSRLYNNELIQDSVDEYSTSLNSLINNIPKDKRLPQKDEHKYNLFEKERFILENTKSKKEISRNFYEQKKKLKQDINNLGGKKSKINDEFINDLILLSKSIIIPILITKVGQLRIKEDKGFAENLLVRLMDLNHTCSVKSYTKQSMVNIISGELYNSKKYLHSSDFNMFEIKHMHSQIKEQAFRSMSTFVFPFKVSDEWDALENNCKSLNYCIVRPL